MAVDPNVNPKKLRPYDEPPRRKRSLIPRTPDSAAIAALVLGLLWLMVATGIGAVWAMLQVAPDLLSLSIEIPMPVGDPLAIELSPATAQAGFTNALVFGWISNGGFAAIFFITPRLLGRRLVDDAMGFGGILIWNIAVAAGLALVYLPALAGPNMLSEFPLPVDGLMLLGLLTVAGAFFRTVVAARARMPYVSIWFFGLALLALLGAYTLGAGFPLLGMGETADALVAAFVARAIGTYWVLGLALGALFYVVPRATGNRLASGPMALTSWLLWAAFAGLAALGSLVDPSVPYAVTSLGNAGAILLVAPVALAVATLALSMGGRWSLALVPGAMGFAMVAMAFLLATALLEAIGALRSVQALVMGTEWPMGAWILAGLGSATFALYALADHAAPRLLRRDWRGSILTNAQLWTTYLGCMVAGLALIGGGLVHGSLVRDGAPKEQITATLAWFWALAASGMGLAALGGLGAVIGLFLMYTTARRADYVVAPGSAVPAAGGE